MYETYCKSKRILIVEDNLLLSLLEERILEKLGCNIVGKVPSGEEAIACHEMTKPECILIDINLQGDLDGIHTVKKIRKKSSVPVIFISGDSELLNSRCSFQKGYTEVIAKPFNGEKLAEALVRIFKREQEGQYS